MRFGSPRIRPIIFNSFHIINLGYHFKLLPHSIKSNRTCRPLVYHFIFHPAIQFAPNASSKNCSFHLSLEWWANGPLIQLIHYGDFSTNMCEHLEFINKYIIILFLFTIKWPTPQHSAHQSIMYYYNNINRMDIVRVERKLLCGEKIWIGAHHGPEVINRKVY